MCTRKFAFDTSAQEGSRRGRGGEGGGVEGANDSRVGVKLSHICAPALTPGYSSCLILF